MNAGRDAVQAGTREWVGLAVLSLTALLLSLDVSVLYLALPLLGRDLGANAPQQLWIMDIYSFMLAGFLVTAGNLGDRIGRRKLLLIGAVTFGIASVVAAYATGPGMLIAARAMLGVAGATLMPSSMALIRTMFGNARQTGTAISLYMSCFLGGMAVGPLVGGLLLERFWWGSAFLLGVPFMVVLLALGPFLLPEYRTPGAGPLDLVSVFLSLASILPAIYGLKSLARDGWHVPPLVFIVAGISFGAVFVKRQRRRSRPLLDLRLFRGITFSGPLVMMLLTGIVMAGTSLMSTLFLQTVLGLSPLQAGLCMMPSSVVMIAGMMAGPALARRFKASYLIAIGMAVGAAGLLLVTQVGASSGPGMMVAGLVVTHAGIAVPMSLGNNLIMTSVSADQAGSAAAVNETSAELGIALGVAALGALGTAVYRGTLPGIMPRGIPVAAADEARESITGAVAAAARAGQAQGADLLAAAREAFTSGLGAVAGVGVLVFLALSALALVTFRRVTEPLDQTSHAPEPQGPTPQSQPVSA